MNSHISLYRAGIGQCGHRFLPGDSSKPCIVAGMIFEGVPGLDSDSDGDVVFHAMCNAITSLTSIPILNGIARDLCRKDGITDSQVFLEKALLSLKPQKIVPISPSLLISITSSNITNCCTILRAQNIDRDFCCTYSGD